MQAGSYTNYFADALIAEAELDSRVVGIHAAMGGGTGMNRFEQRFPERTFDVGIAEQVWPGACAPCTTSLYLLHSKPSQGNAPACRLRRHTEPLLCQAAFSVAATLLCGLQVHLAAVSVLCCSVLLVSFLGLQHLLALSALVHCKAWEHADSRNLPVARGHICGRTGGGGHCAHVRHLLQLPAARLRSDRA